MDNLDKNHKLPAETQYLSSGNLYLDKKQYALAQEAFNKAIEINPHNGYAYGGLGHVYLQQKKFAQAISQFSQALALNPQSIDPHEGLGFCYWEQGRIEEASVEFSYVLKSNPNSERAHFGLGLCYYQRKKLDKAIEEFNLVLKINPRHPQAYSHLGLCYHEQKEFSQAIDQFNKALEMDPQDSLSHDVLGSAHSGLGSIYLEQRLHTQAEAEFEEALRFDSDDIFAHQMLGYIYKRRGKHDLAVAEFIKATNLLLKENANKKVEHFQEGKMVRLDNNKNEELVVKILRMPSFNNEGQINSTELNCSLLPPLALGQITAHLRAHGIKIDQDDLNIKIYYDNYYSKMTEKGIDISVFFDEERISRYISGGKDEDLESILERVERKTNFYGYNTILLSFSIIPSNSSDIMFILCLSRFLKKKYNPILILGGCSHSIELLRKYDCKDIDLIIYGDGGVALLNLLLALKNEKELTEIFGSQIEENGKCVFSGVYPPLKPDFSGLPIEHYKYKGLNSNYDNGIREVLEEFHRSNTLLLPFKFIRGCPYECIFCAESSNKSIYVLAPSRVALYLKELQEEYNPAGFFFLSDTINISRQYINGLCGEIINNKVKILWSDCARVDNLDRDTLFKMREAGCIRLIFGMETASARLLKYVDKRITLAGLENILKWSDEAGIWTGLEIICGFPHERDNDIEETITFLNKNRDYINTVYLNQFALRYGSVLFQNAKNFGIENIIELNQYANEEFLDFHKYGYDETGGLKWQDKKRQILTSYKKLLSGIPGFASFPVYEFEHFLFFLYNKLSDKRQIYDMFIRVALEKNKLLQRLLCTEKSSMLKASSPSALE